MITKWMSALYHIECELFRTVNGHFDHKAWNRFFSLITHFGGAKVTIGAALLLILFMDQPGQRWGTECAIALAGSHIVVAAMKRIYPRTRPYLSLEKSRVGKHPLKDHSFPSGHTTAIFSLITPLIFHIPLFAIILYPLALCVAVSRVYLGLHYPSDVLGGLFLGIVFGILVILTFQ